MADTTGSTTQDLIGLCSGNFDGMFRYQMLFIPMITLVPEYNKITLPMSKFIDL